MTGREARAIEATAILVVCSPVAAPLVVDLLKRLLTLQGRLTGSVATPKTVLILESGRARVLAF
ncbi:MAG: hypothetical protein M1118_04145 [Chloroflexi bacterium]|nr:hypothetical protein [Chloroflexota bacterium]